MIRSKLLSAGHYLPEKIMTNKDLESLVDTSDEWIQKRTGIQQRHVAADTEMTSDLAANAAKDALQKAGVKAADVDMLIVATATPDLTFPSTATQVQHKIGMTGGFAFDMQAVCSGFVYGLAMADNFIKAKQAKTVIVIGAEIFSRILDWNDRGTCVLFGDGAGAVVLQAADGESGILSTHLYSDGQYTDLLKTNGGIGSNQVAGVVTMQGRDVFKHAVSKMAAAVDTCLSANGLTKDDIDWLVPHQANKRIIDSMGEKLDLPSDRVIVTVDKHANTSAASIPLALSVAFMQDKFKHNDLILLEALGAGFTWGSALIKY